MTEVFISYVREDERIVSSIRQILESNGVKVWLDKENLQPGTRWKMAIENAIRAGTYFISVHSRARSVRERTYANEEFVVAIEEFRKRPPTASWLIPVIVDDSDVDDWPLGGGFKYSDIHRCDLKDWSKGIATLLRSLGVSDPILDLGQPLAPGLPSFVKILHGHVNYEYIQDLPAVMQGLEHRVSGGWCQRRDDGIIAYFELSAPMRSVERFNKLIGYTGFYAFCADKQISEYSERPSVFVYKQRLVAPRGSALPDFSTGREIVLPIDIPLISEFEARGHIAGFEFSGEFDASVTFQVPGQERIHQSRGVFRMTFGPDHPRPT